MLLALTRICDADAETHQRRPVPSATGVSIKSRRFAVDEPTWG